MPVIRWCKLTEVLVVTAVINGCSGFRRLLRLADRCPSQTSDASDAPQLIVVLR